MAKTGIPRVKDVGVAEFKGDEYPPKSWVCPYCKKDHSKPHYSHPGQIDYSKEPAEVGRVRFNREDPYGCDTYNDDTKLEKKLEKKTGPSHDEYGNPNPQFCPHCGWQGQIIIIYKVRN